MMRNITKLCISIFIALSMAYGFYTSRLLPSTVGIVSAVLYALSLKRGEETSIKLTGLVAMFSSIFALWKSPLRYLAVVGIGLLAILEVSIRIRTYLISSPKLDRGDLS